MELDPSAYWIIPAFVVGWVLVTGLISIIGGWSSLARRYPLPEHKGEVIEKFRWRSVNFNYLSAYRSCVNITLTDLGVILKPTFLFSAFHKPIFFLWKDISNTEYVKGIFGSKRLVFYLGRTRVAVGGRPAEVIKSKLSNPALSTTR
jgi:hypothetical protein